MRFALLLLLACGASEAAPTAVASSESEAEGEAEAEGESEGETEAETGPALVFTRISFDLRGMPHRGPYDVDPGLIDSRLQYLMQQARDAAGSPEPRLTYNPGISVFRAEFFGDDAQAQCERTIAAVAPDRSDLPPRAALSEPSATACAPIEP